MSVVAVHRLFVFVTKVTCEGALKPFEEGRPYGVGAERVSEGTAGSAQRRKLPRSMRRERVRDNGVYPLRRVGSAPELFPPRVC